MTDNINKDEIAELRREIAALKPTPPSDLEAAKWRDEMHQLAERRAAGHLPFSRADLEAMEQAAPTHVVRAIACRDNRAPTGPSSQGAIPSSQQVSNIRSGGSPGGGTGWAREIPLGPQPGIHHIDRLMLHDDIEFRRQRIAEAQALKAATEEKPGERQTQEGDA